MSVFDLATRGRRDLDEEAVRNVLQPGDQGLPAFTGFGEAQKSWMGASARATQYLSLAGSTFAIGVDKAEAAGEWLGWQTLPADERARRKELGLGPRAAGTDAQDWFFKHAVEGVGNRTVDYWRPDPDAMGSAARAMSMVGEVGGSIPQMFGMPSVFLGQSGVSPGMDLVRQGVDAETAGAVGGINLLATGVGMRIPAAWGSTLSQRLATGAGSNLGIGVAADVASSETLEAAGFEDQAQRFAATDPYTRSLDVLMGLAFGVRAHVDAPRLTPSQRDAVLTARNNDHLHRQTLPGEPVTPEAAMAHANALSEAIGQVLRGESINVAGMVDPAGFRLRPELAPAGSDYVAYRRTLESGNRPDARASSSSAFGIDQFTAGTWRRIVAQEQPAWARGLSDADLLAQRGNPERSGEMAAALDRANAAALEAAGRVPTVHNLYALHHFGQQRGLAFARAADDVRVDQILGAEQIAANPYLRGKTKGEVITEWDARARRSGVEVPARDPASVQPDPIEAPRETFAPRDMAARRPTVEELRSGAELFDEPPPQATRAEFEAWTEGRLRVELPATLEGLRGDLQRYQWDAAEAAEQARLRPEDQTAVRYAEEQQAQLDALRARIAKAEAGQVELPEPPVLDALYAREQARAARSATRSAPDAAESPATAARAFLDDAAARVEAGETVGADFGPVRVQASPDGFRVTGLAELDPGDATGAAAHLGEIFGGSPARRPGTTGGDSATRAASGPLDEAIRMARESPDLQVIDGFDADGNPRYRAAGEVLAEIEAERAQAQADARAFPAAVGCFIRMGS